MAIKIDNNKIIVLNPATLDEAGSVCMSNEDDVVHALEIAKTYNAWSSLSLKKRCAVINKFRKVVLKHAAQVKNTLKNETGKKDFDVFVEFFTFLEHSKEMSKIAKRALKKSKRNPGLMKNKKAYVQYEPMGIAGIISPWNYPLATPINSTIDALLAGNNVVLKPSEYTPLTPQVIKKLWDEHTEYSDAFQIVNGLGDVGKMLVDSNVTDIICFTGSTEVGRKIASGCAPSLKPCILELGGKDPMIILKDASLNRAVESAIFGGMSNAGQTCISTEEVYVEKDVFDYFLSKLSKRVEGIKAGLGDDADLGPMIVSQTKEKVHEHINEIKDTCDVIIGGSKDSDKYIAPTIVVNPPDSSRIVNEETFGPVISVRSFEDEDELIDKIHKTGYGLSSSIFSKNKKRSSRIIKRIKTGNVSINDVLTHYGIASLPFGGEGISGLGKMHGPEGLRSLSRTKSIVENRFNFITEPWWFGRSKTIEKILKKAVNLLYR